MRAQCFHRIVTGWDLELHRNWNMVIKCDQNKYLGLIDLVEGFECFTECEIKGPEINVISILADF